MFRGTTMGTLTSPLELAWNGNVWTVLSSWISPFWLAGRWLAFTTTESPALTVDADSESVGLAAATRSTPRMRSTTRTPAANAANKPLRDFFLATGWEVAGYGTATVALGFTASTRAGAGIAAAAPATGAASGTVEATAGPITTVRAPAGSVFPASAAARASTNAVQLSHRAAGSLARPRMTTASTCGFSALLRALGSGGSRCTCA